MSGPFISREGEVPSQGLINVVYRTNDGCHALYVGRPAPFAMSYIVGRENKRTNNRTMFPSLKNNAAAAYQGPVRIELLKDAGLLLYVQIQFHTHIAFPFMNRKKGP